MNYIRNILVATLFRAGQPNGNIGQDNHLLASVESSWASCFRIPAIKESISSK
jgi:hypothetical protein